MRAMLLVACLAASAETGRAQVGAERSAPPKRLAYTEPRFPAEAREVRPALQGIVILELTLNEEGRPVDVKILRAIPLLDRAAVAAAQQWRYEPTLVDGVPARVVVEEIVDMFPDKDSRATYWADMLSKRTGDPLYRVLAAQRLESIGVRKKRVIETLQKATTDADPRVQAAASRALETLERP